MLKVNDRIAANGKVATILKVGENGFSYLVQVEGGSVDVWVFHPYQVGVSVFVLNGVK